MKLMLQTEITTLTFQTENDIDNLTNKLSSNFAVHIIILQDYYYTSCNDTYNNWYCVSNVESTYQYKIVF